MHYKVSDAMICDDDDDDDDDSIIYYIISIYHFVCKNVE